jgi:hypothetical protein
MLFFVPKIISSPQKSIPQKLSLSVFHLSIYKKTDKWLFPFQLFWRILQHSQYIFFN